MSAQPNGRSRRLGEIFECPVCGWPSATRQGMASHRRLHSRGPSADRNWSIFYAYREEGASVRELERLHNLSTTTIYRILQRGIAYPGIYELEEGS